MEDGFYTGDEKFGTTTPAATYHFMHLAHANYVAEKNGLSFDDILGNLAALMTEVMNGYVRRSQSIRAGDESH